MVIPISICTRSLTRKESKESGTCQVPHSGEYQRLDCPKLDLVNTLRSAIRVSDKNGLRAKGLDELAVLSEFEDVTCFSLSPPVWFEIRKQNRAFVKGQQVLFKIVGQSHFSKVGKRLIRKQT